MVLRKPGRRLGDPNHGVRPAIVDPDWNNFAPRAGFAYRPAFAKNTVVRGGFGIYYATDNWNELQFEVMGPPFYQSQTLTSDPTKPTQRSLELVVEHRNRLAEAEG